MFSYSSALVTIATTNFNLLLEFYSHLFSQKPGTLLPNVYASFRLPGLHLGIFQLKDATLFQPGSGAIGLCLEADNLEQAIAHTGQLPEIINASHGREAYIYDPDGNRIILYQGNVENLRLLAEG
jgi:predicted enzyme related to lactoylglutathione lyase